MKKQTPVAIGVVFSFPLWGILEALADGRVRLLGAALWLFHTVFIAGGLCWWATLDSAERNEQLSDGWTAALVCLGIASLPFYLHKTRPPQRRWISIAKGIGLFIVAAVLYVASYLITALYFA